MQTSLFARSISTLVAMTLLMPLGGLLLPVETAHADYPQCSDGIDNDRDGQTDYPEESNCPSIDGNSEWPDNGVFVNVTDNRDTVAPGDAVIYQITLKQQREDVQLMDVTFHVPFQSGITYVSDDGSIIGGTTGKWIKVAVFKNNIRHLSVHAITSPYSTPGKLLVARVVANGSSSDDTTMVTLDKAIPYAQNQLEVTVSDHRDNAQPGDVLDYLVTVRNPEQNAATVHVRVGIPAALRVIDAADGSITGSEIVWQNITINPKQERTFSFRAVVDDRVPKNFPIQVVARAGNIVAYDRTITGGTPYSLFSSITDNRTNAARGDLLAYVIHIDNSSGQLDTNASIDASLPEHAEFVSATEGGTWDGNNVRWLRMQVAPGGSRDLRFTVRVRSDAPDGALLRATSRVQGFTSTDVTQVGGGNNLGYAPSVPDNNQYYGNTALNVQKTNDRQNAAAGSLVSYTVTVRNTTGSTQQNVLVNDNYNPSEFRVTDAGSGDVDNGRITWTIDSLRSGEVRTFTYSGRLSRSLPGGTSVVNTVHAYTETSPGVFTPVAMSNVEVNGQRVLPQTGIEDFFDPLENTAQFLTPISAAAEGNGLPLAIWIAVVMAGLVTGGLMGKKFVL